jgi:hypothetical protein
MRIFDPADQGVVVTEGRADAPDLDTLAGRREGDLGLVHGGAEEVGEGRLEGRRQRLEGGERSRDLPELDLRDHRARDPGARRQLRQRQAGAAAQLMQGPPDPGVEAVG